MTADEWTLHALGVQEAMNALLDAVMTVASRNDPGAAVAMAEVIRNHARTAAVHPSEHFASPVIALSREAGRLLLKEPVHSP